MKLATKWIPALFAAAAVSGMPSALAAPAINLGEPVTMAPDFFTIDPDGNLQTWDEIPGGFEFRLYDSNLNVIKEFTIHVISAAGLPVSSGITDGPSSMSACIFSKNFYNNDDLYEVLFNSGMVYNELGQYLGIIPDYNYRLIFKPSEEYTYVDGGKILEEADLSEIWIERYNASIPRWLKEVCEIADESIHFDFGASALSLMLDSKGMDMVCDISTYDWFYQWTCYLSHNSNTSYANAYPYIYHYLCIDRCNEIIKGLKENAPSVIEQTILANAYALRGWNYTALAQQYQFTYFGNESKPCVPLVDEENFISLTVEGIQRSTVGQTYDFILEDLDRAIMLLDDNTDCRSDITSESPKTMIGTATAYGLRARVNLIMHRYAEAESDARKAIELFDGSPYSMNMIQPGGFRDINEQSWMWGLDYPAGLYSLASFQGHISPFVALGYGMNEFVPRKINKSLYNSIPATDVRRRHFLDGAGNYAPDGNQYEPKWTPYGNVKFGTGTGAQGATIDEIADYPMMRVEEMYYIAAEAMAMGGKVGEAVQYLKSFVKTYRDPSFTVSSQVSATELRDIIWHQRRIEFWGEGLSFYDIMRLEKGVNRIGGGFPESHVYNIPANDFNLLTRFPVKLQGGTYVYQNMGLDESNNNPECESPAIYSE